MSTKLKNFTPVIDEVADDVGFVAALVYGAVFRYAQMSSGRCTAAADTIAARINASAKTVRRHLKTLVKEEYLVDKTPKRRNAPHVYVLTDKAGITIHITGRSQEQEKDDDGLDSATNQTETVGLSDQARLDLESNEETLLRDSSKSIGEDAASFPDPDNPLNVPEDGVPFADERPNDPTPAKTKTVQAARPKTEYDEFKELVAWLLYKTTPETIDALSETAWKHIHKTIKRLQKTELTPDHLRQFWDWWRKTSWKYKKSASRPTPNDITDNWPKFLQWYKAEAEYKQWQEEQQVQRARKLSTPGNGSNNNNIPADPQAAMKALLSA